MSNRRATARPAAHAVAARTAAASRTAALRSKLSAMLEWIIGRPCQLLCAKYRQRIWLLPQSWPALRHVPADAGRRAMHRRRRVDMPRLGYVATYATLAAPAAVATNAAVATIAAAAVAAAVQGHLQELLGCRQPHARVLRDAPLRSR